MIHRELRQKLAITLGVLMLLPVLLAHSFTWSYSNYLYELSVDTDDTLNVGGTKTVSVNVGANTDVVVHVELKGDFTWGDWIYDSKEVPVSTGESTITVTLDVPIKLIVEPSNDFYVYAYVTLPGDIWNHQLWGIRKDMSLQLPDTISLEDMTAILSHLKYKVETSGLPPGIETKVVERLDELSYRLEDEYSPEMSGKLANLFKLLVVLKNDAIDTHDGTPPSYHSNQDFLDGMTTLEHGDAAEWHVPFSGPPLPTGGMDTKRAEAFIRANGLDAGEAVDFWTEASLFAAAGLPALVLGPGNIAQAHAVDEWVSLDQLQLALDSYLTLVNNDD